MFPGTTALLRGRSDYRSYRTHISSTECRAFIVSNVQAEKRIFKDSEITWQEIEIHLLHIKWSKNPLFHYLFSSWVCGSQTAEHKSWSKPCWNINKPTSTRGRNSACSVGTFFFFLDVGWQPGWWKEKPKRITALQQQKRELEFRKYKPCASL